MGILKHPEVEGLYQVDEVDRRVLRGFMADASLPYKELSDATGLPPSTVFDRVKRLRREGIIKTVVPMLDTERLGLGTIAFITVKIGKGGDCCDAAEEIAKLPEALEVHEIAGDYDLLVKVKLRDNLDLHNFASMVLEMPGVDDVRSIVTVRTVKEDIRPKI